MFRQGKPRSFLHNLRLASLLSVVAGLVNVVGVLAVYTLTSNVTGHIAFFAEKFVEARYGAAFAFMLFTLTFLAGAFLCGLLVEYMLTRRPEIAHGPPMLLEMFILVAVGTGDGVGTFSVALPLLFAMGLQNALVTKVSRATVRTTHLTGLFTDLGIELAQLFFYDTRGEVRTLRRSIYLRISIIVFFFLGGLAGGFLYYVFAIRALLFAAGFLLVALYYDNIRYILLHAWRRRR